MNVEERANDMIQALSIQRNKHADDAAGLFADLLEAQRKIAHLEAEVQRLKEAKKE